MNCLNLNEIYSEEFCGNNAVRFRWTSSYSRSLVWDTTRYWDVDEISNCYYVLSLLQLFQATETTRYRDVDEILNCYYVLPLLQLFQVTETTRYRDVDEISNCYYVLPLLQLFQVTETTRYRDVDEISNCYYVLPLLQLFQVTETLNSELGNYFAAQCEKPAVKIPESKRL